MIDQRGDALCAEILIQLDDIDIGGRQAGLLPQPAGNGTEPGGGIQRISRATRAWKFSALPAAGLGVHFCLGVHLARMELRTFFRELLPRIESIELAGELEYTATTVVGGPKRVLIRYQLRAAADASKPTPMR